MTPTDLPALREAVAKIEPCPKCGGDGFLVTNSSHAEHDPRCDGTCRFCPIEVPDQDIGPCDCALAQASITEDDHWRLVCTLRALLDELEAARIEIAHLREAFMTMERAYNDCDRVREQHLCEIVNLQADLAAARAVLDSAQWPSSEANGRLLLNVDAAAWQAWKGLTP